MSGNRFQEHTVTILMHSDDRVVQWEQLPVRLRRYEVTRYICPEIPGFTDYEDTIVGDDSTLMAEETFRISHEVLVSYPATASYFSPILAAHGVSAPEQRDVARRVTDLSLCMARSTVRPIAIYIMDVDTVAVSGQPYLWPVWGFFWGGRKRGRRWGLNDDQGGACDWPAIHRGAGDCWSGGLLDMFGRASEGNVAGPHDLHSRFS